MTEDNKNIAIEVTQDDDAYYILVTDDDDDVADPLETLKKIKGGAVATITGFAWFCTPWILLYWLGSWLHAIDKH